MGALPRVFRAIPWRWSRELWAHSLTAPARGARGPGRALEWKYFFFLSTHTSPPCHGKSKAADNVASAALHPGLCVCVCVCVSAGGGSASRGKRQPRGEARRGEARRGGGSPGAVWPRKRRSRSELPRGVGAGVLPTATSSSTPGSFPGSLPVLSLPGGVQKRPRHAEGCPPPPHLSPPQCPGPAPRCAGARPAGGGLGSPPAHVPSPAEEGRRRRRKRARAKRSSWERVCKSPPPSPPEGKRKARAVASG